MATSRTPRLVLALLLLALLLPALAIPGTLSPATAQAGPPNLAVYHQLTTRPASAWIESPVLSGDGQRVIWAESPQDPKQLNRIYALNVEGGQPSEIDAYHPLCYCGTQVDLSDDGSTIVSTDRVALRVVSGVGTAPQARELLRLANDVIGTVRLSGDGRTVVFLVLRDARLSEPNPRKVGAPIPRGLWAISAAGGDPIHLAGNPEIAAVSGVSVSQLASERAFHSDIDTQPLAVSDDGRRIAFGAFDGNGDGVFSLSEGVPLTRLFGPVGSVRQVAVSGDGQTVAFAVNSDGVDDVAILAGGTLKPLPNHRLGNQDRLQLNRDGTKLLTVSSEEHADVLMDVATLAKRPLVPLVPPAAASQGPFPLLFRTGRFATMNAAGTRVVYAVDVPAQASRPGGFGLVLVEVGPSGQGAAPLVRGVQVNPGTIPPDPSQPTDISTELSWEGSLVGAWLAILRDGQPDNRIGRTDLGTGVVALQDTVGHDPRRLQGAFAADNLSYRPISGQADDPGPRTLRLMIESEADDGLRHATVLDVEDRLRVGGQSSVACAVGPGVVFRTSTALPGMAGVGRWAGEWASDPSAVTVESFHAELSLTGLEPNPNVDSYAVQISGGCVVIKAVNLATGSRFSFTSSRVATGPGQVVPSDPGGKGVVVFPGTGEFAPPSHWGAPTHITFYLALADDLRSIAFCSMPPRSVVPLTRAGCLADPIAVLARVN